MSGLALPSNETLFWTVLIALVAVLVLGLIALMATLLYMVRSISQSIVQLRDVAEIQAAGGLPATPEADADRPGSGPPDNGSAPDPGTATGSSTEVSSTEGSSTEGGSREPGRPSQAE